MSEKSKSRKRRRGPLGVLVRLLLVLIVLGAVGVGLAPTFVSMGLGQDAIRSAIAAQVNGTVSTSSMRIGWRGPQTITGLQIVDDTGRAAVEVDVSVGSALLPLLTGGNDRLDVAIGGTVRGDVDEHGNVSFTRLVASSDPDGADDPDRPAGGGSGSAPGTKPTPLAITIENLVVELDDALSGRQVVLEQVNGTVDVNGRDTVVKLDGTSRSGALSGSVSVDVALKGDGVRGQIKLATVPVLMTSLDAVLEDLDLALHADDLADNLVVDVDATGAIAGHGASSLAGHVEIRAPRGADGSFSVGPRQVKGRLEGVGIPTSVLQPLVTIEGIDLALDLGPVVGFTAVATGDDAPFDVDLASEHAKLSLHGRFDADAGSIELTPSSVEARLRPELLAALGVPLKRETPAAVVLGLEGAFAPRSSRLKADVTVDEKRLGDVMVELTTGDGDQPTRGRVETGDLDVGAVEEVLGLEERLVRQWTGRKASLAVDVEQIDGGWKARIEPRSRHIQGSFDATIDAGLLVIEPSGLQLNARKRTVEDVLFGKRDRLGIEIAEDAPITLEIRRVQWPLGSAAMDPPPPIVPGKVDAEVRVPALSFVRHGQTYALRNAVVVAKSDDLDAGVSYGIMSDDEGDTIAINADVAISGDRRIDTSDATAKRIPTALLCALAGLDPLLVSAVGDTVSAAVTAVRWGGDGGSIDLRLDTANEGVLKAFLVQEGDVLRTTSDSKILGRLALTRELRDEILKPIHPVFADIRQTARRRIKVTVTDAFVPLDGDVSGLRAKLEIDVGKISLQSSSLLLGLLTAFQEADGTTVDGELETIRATIEGGVVTYEQFALHVDRFTMRYEGSIDLNTGTVDLKTEIPLEGLAGTFRELGSARGIVVPITSKGTFDAIKTEIAPQFLERATEQGLQQIIGDALGDLLKGGGGR